MISTKKGTTQTYDQIAEIFFEKNKDRSQIEDNLNEFAKHCQANDLILDVGCGPGFDGDLLRSKGLRVMGLELSAQMIKIGKKRFSTPIVQADMEALPFQQKIDGLWVNASLLHLERNAVPHTLGEFYHVLKPNGKLFISVKKGAGEQWETGDENAPRWFTYWADEQLGNVVTGAGFHILKIWSNHFWIKCCAVKKST